MTITDLPITAITAPITLDLYKDIHKGIRVELFSVTTEAGWLDPAQGIARGALATQVADVVDLLTGHAAHEDAAIQPVLEARLPALAERIEVDHLTLEARMDDLVEMAAEQAFLGGMRAGAPAPVFGGVCSLVRSVLDPGDYQALARRLDLA